MQEVNFRQYIPDTPTVNPDRKYFTNGELFIKQDINKERGRNEAAFLSLFSYCECGFQKVVYSKLYPEYHELCTKFVYGQTLESLKKSDSLTSEAKAKVLIKLSYILTELEGQGVTHGDINESNLLYDGGVLTLIDFETARQTPKGQNNPDINGQYFGLEHIIKFLYAD